MFNVKLYVCRYLPLSHLAAWIETGYKML